MASLFFIFMAYVVTKPCLGTKDRSCVEVCPVDCFYNIKKKKYNDLYSVEPKDGEEGMLMINGDECINCGACETECPVEAIYEDSAVPQDCVDFIKYAEEEFSTMGPGEMDQTRCTSK